MHGSVTICLIIALHSMAFGTLIVQYQYGHRSHQVLRLLDRATITAFARCDTRKCLPCICCEHLSVPFASDLLPFVSPCLDYPEDHGDRLSLSREVIISGAVKRSRYSRSPRSVLEPVGPFGEQSCIDSRRRATLSDLVLPLLRWR